MNATANEPDFPHSYRYSEISSILTDPRKHVVIGTSGSTGAPKQVLVSARALASSSQIASETLGIGRWLLALPTNHIAGVNVLARSAISGIEPAIIPATERFTQETFINATIRMDNESLGKEKKFVSLVPTQLHRLLEPTGQHRDSLAALKSYSAVLVGGAATAPNLLAEARSAGVHIVTSYGMSETCGGCVYDGLATGDTQVRVDSEGRVWLSGSSLASGYLAHQLETHDPLCTDQHALADSQSFVTDPDGTTWHKTNDLGTLTAPASPSEKPFLDVIGRADDTILTGGLNIAPARIDAALSGNYGIINALTVGVPDPEWGARVITLVTKRTDTTLHLDHIRQAVTDTLGKGYAPRAIYPIDQLPLTNSGKPDRRKAVEIAIAIEAHK